MCDCDRAPAVASTVYLICSDALRSISLGLSCAHMSEAATKKQVTKSLANTKQPKLSRWWMNIRRCYMCEDKGW